MSEGAEGDAVQDAKWTSNQRDYARWLTARLGDLRMDARRFARCADEDVKLPHLGDVIRTAIHAIEDAQTVLEAEMDRRG